MARQLEQEIYDMESMSETHTMLRGEKKEQSRWSRTVLFAVGLLALTAVAVGAAVFSSNNRASLHKSSDKVVQLSEDDVWSAVLSPNAMKQYEQEKAASKEVDKAESVDKAAAEAALQREQAASKVEEAMKQAVSKAKASAQQAGDQVSATFEAGANKAASAVQSAQAKAESTMKSAQSQAASSMKDVQSQMTQAQKDPIAAAQKMMQNLVGDNVDQAKEAAAKSGKSAEDFGASIQAAAKKAMGAFGGGSDGKQGPNWGSLLGGGKAPAPAAPAVPAIAPAPAAPAVPPSPKIVPVKVPAAQIPPAVPAAPIVPAAPAAPAAAAAAVVPPAAAMPTTTTTTTDDPEESALAPEVAKSDKDPCSSDQEFHGGLCYAKCATLTAGSHPCRSSAWSCCAVAAGPTCGEQASLENCWVHPGFCFGYAVSGHDEETQQGDGCPTGQGACLTNEEMFMNSCYKKCSILTQGTHNYRTGAATCCSKSSHFECLWPGNLKTDPLYNLGGGAGDHNSGTPGESHPPMDSLAESK